MVVFVAFSLLNCTSILAFVLVLRHRCIANVVANEISDHWIILAESESEVT